MSCENCGLPEGVLDKKDGHRITITRKAANNFKHDSKVSVWVCSFECGVQLLGLSKYGKASNKWPVTLAQYRTVVQKQNLITEAKSDIDKKPRKKKSSKSKAQKNHHERTLRSKTRRR